MSEKKEVITKETDDSLDTLLENMKITQQEDFDAMIEKSVSRRIRRIVLRTLATILIPLIIGYIVRRGSSLSRYGEAYVEELNKYKEIDSDEL